MQLAGLIYINSGENCVGERAVWCNFDTPNNQKIVPGHPRTPHPAPLRYTHGPSPVLVRISPSPSSLARTLSLPHSEYFAASLHAGN